MSARKIAVPADRGWRRGRAMSVDSYGSTPVWKPSVGWLAGGPRGITAVQFPARTEPDLLPTKTKPEDVPKIQ
jgi:hypothetical protein